MTDSDHSSNFPELLAANAEVNRSSRKTKSHLNICLENSGFSQCVTATLVHRNHQKLVSC